MVLLNSEDYGARIWNLADVDMFDDVEEFNASWLVAVWLRSKRVNKGDILPSESFSLETPTIFHSMEGHRHVNRGNIQSINQERPMRMGTYAISAPSPDGTYHAGRRGNWL